jgi:hypothetical protein
VLGSEAATSYNVTLSDPLDTGMMLRSVTTSGLGWLSQH